MTFISRYYISRAPGVSGKSEQPTTTARGLQRRGAQCSCISCIGIRPALAGWLTRWPPWSFTNPMWHSHSDTRVYVNQLFGHCVFIYSDFHWQLVSVLRNGSQFCFKVHHRCTGVHIFGDANHRCTGVHIFRDFCPNLIMCFPNNV